MSEGMKKFIPKRKPDDRFFSPPLWLDRNTKSAIIKKRKSWKAYKYSKSVLAQAKYVKDRNECTNAVRSAKMSFERKIALESKSKVKSFWNYINSKLKTRSGIGTLERSDGTLASSEADKVEVLNKFFTSVFTRTEDLQNFDTNCNLDIRLSDILFSQQDILKKLNSLKTDKSAGPDGLHPKVLFEVCLKYGILFTILYTCFLISLSKKAKFQLSGKRQLFLLFSKKARNQAQAIVGQLV